MSIVTLGLGSHSRTTRSCFGLNLLVLPILDDFWSQLAIMGMRISLLYLAKALMNSGGEI
jgi:hypothetical protein